MIFFPNIDELPVIPEHSHVQENTIPGDSFVNTYPSILMLVSNTETMTSVLNDVCSITSCTAISNSSTRPSSASVSRVSTRVSVKLQLDNHVKHGRRVYIGQCDLVNSSSQMSALQYMRNLPLPALN